VKVAPSEYPPEVDTRGATEGCSAPSSRFFFIFHTGLFVKVAPPEYPPEVDILPRSGASAVATSLPLTRGATEGCSAPSSRFFYFYLYFYK